MAMVTVAHAQLRIGAKFGLTVANQQVTLQDGNSTEKDFGGSHPTFHFGVVTELPLAKKLWLRPELLFSVKVRAGASTTPTVLPIWNSRLST